MSVLIGSSRGTVAAAVYAMTDFAFEAAFCPVYHAVHVVIDCPAYHAICRVAFRGSERSSRGSFVDPSRAK